MLVEREVAYRRVAHAFEHQGHLAGTQLVADIRGHVSRIEHVQQVIGKSVPIDLEMLWRARLIGAEKAARIVGTRVLNAELRHSNEEMNEGRRALGLAEESPLQVREPQRIFSIVTGRSRI